MCSVCFCACSLCACICYLCTDMLSAGVSVVCAQTCCLRVYLLSVRSLVVCVCAFVICAGFCCLCVQLVSVCVQHVSVCVQLVQVKLCSCVQVVRGACEQVSSVLYVHMDPVTSTTQQQHALTVSQASHIIKSIYSSPALATTDTSASSSAIDVRVILTGFKGVSTVPTNTKFPIEKVLVDSYLKGQLSVFKNRYKSYLCGSEPIILLKEDQETSVQEDKGEILPNVEEKTSSKIYKDIVAGGTFDSIHTGHKILLSQGLLKCTNKFTIGIADGPLLAKKTLTELIEPVEVRMSKLQDLLTDLDPSIECYLEPINEPMGPSGRDPNMEMIIVSQETLKGGHYVNKVRAERNLSVLDVEVINIVQDIQRSCEEEEEKVSSSSSRMRSLGTLLKEPSYSDKQQPFPPYIIGLTGGSASGKSSIAMTLESMGASIIDCDKLGHKAYEVGTLCHRKLLQEFGSEIQAEDGSINRRTLGALVFDDETKLRRLNQLVWPEIAQLVTQELRSSSLKGRQVVVLDAAVLLEASWQHMCHEVSTAVRMMLPAMLLALLYPVFLS